MNKRQISKLFDPWIKFQASNGDKIVQCCRCGKTLRHGYRLGSDSFYCFKCKLKTKREIKAASDFANERYESVVQQMRSDLCNAINTKLVPKILPDVPPEQRPKLVVRGVKP